MFSIISLLSLLLFICLSNGQHDHDDHTCHYGYIPGLATVLAEDECGSQSLGNLSVSYIFECYNNTLGMIYGYNNLFCSGDPVNMTYVTDTTMFDCSSESECDIVVLDAVLYNMTGCMGGISATAVTGFSTGATCVNTDLGVYWGVSYNEVGNNITITYYDDSDCGSVAFSLGFETGCVNFTDIGTSTYRLVYLEDDDMSTTGVSIDDTSTTNEDSGASDDSSSDDDMETTASGGSEDDAAFGLIGYNNIIYAVSAATIAVLFVTLY